MLQFIDTHCHLNFSHFFDDFETVKRHAFQQGVYRLVIPGADLDTSHSAIQLAETHPEFFAAVGVHPGDSNSWNDAALPSLNTLAAHPKVVAIGEIGLDYYRDRAPRSIQQSVFLQQLETARSHNKPVIIHNRQSWTDLWDILKNWLDRLRAENHPLIECPGVLHSCDEEYSTIKIALDYNFMVGISGPVTYKTALERKVLARSIPLNQMVLETDAPYLTPHPHRGKRNEPAFIPLIAQEIAIIKQLAVEKIAYQTTLNANRLFKI